MNTPKIGSNYGLGKPATPDTSAALQAKKDLEEILRLLTPDRAGSPVPHIPYFSPGFGASPLVPTGGRITPNMLHGITGAAVPSGQVEASQSASNTLQEWAKNLFSVQAKGTPLSLAPLEELLRIEGKGPPLASDTLWERAKNSMLGWPQYARQAEAPSGPPAPAPAPDTGTDTGTDTVPMSPEEIYFEKIANLPSSIGATEALAQTLQDYISSIQGMRTSKPDLGALLAGMSMPIGLTGEQAVEGFNLATGLGTLPFNEGMEKEKLAATLMPLLMEMRGKIGAGPRAEAVQELELLRGAKILFDTPEFIAVQLGNGRFAMIDKKTQEVRMLGEQPTGQGGIPQGDIFKAVINLMGQVQTEKTPSAKDAIAEALRITDTVSGRGGGPALDESTLIGMGGVVTGIQPIEGKPYKVIQFVNGVTVLLPQGNK